MAIWSQLPGRWLAAYLATERHAHGAAAPAPPGALAACLTTGDVLLVEGNSRFSTAVKYLTQSTWSHAALYVGHELAQQFGAPMGHCFVEADVAEGVRTVSLTTFEGYHTRICRPVGLTLEERQQVCAHALARKGHRYDLRNVWDLARYLIPTPPVPLRWRRRMLALGSGDPTRAICSTLIAQAFQSIRYPILPVTELRPANDPACAGCVDELLHIRHHSLFAPRDFDVSPYFRIIKPTVEAGFDFRLLRWAQPV